MRPAIWLPPLLWMAMILTLSSDLGSAQHTSRFLIPLLRALWPDVDPQQIQAVHFALRKGAHLTEYAILAALWFRALAVGRGWTAGRAAMLALALSVTCAIVDETYQSFTPSRGGSAADVVLDSTGALIAIAAAAAGWRRALGATTTALLLFAAAGGMAVLVVDRYLDVPSGLLWVSTAGAGVVLVGLLLTRRRAARR